MHANPPLTPRPLPEVEGAALERRTLDLRPSSDRRKAQQYQLLIELVAYLRQRQVASATMVEERMRKVVARFEADERRQTELLQHVEQVQQRVGKLNRDVAELRGLVETMRAAKPLRRASSNGVVPTDGQLDKATDEAPARPPLSGNVLLRVEGLAKEIGDVDILRDIDFEVYEGEILGLIGPNGAGKTTLMECLAGMRPRTAGTFYIGDEAPASWDPKDLLFYLPNSVLPYAELYTIEVLQFFSRLYEVEASRWEQIVWRDLSLGPALSKRVSALSKGNLQRLLIAIALMSPQPLLALDEPFDGLDLHQTQAMMGILRRLREHSRTLMLCIHQLNDAERICDRFLLLSGGLLVGVGTMAELRAQTGLASASLEQIFLALTS